MGEGNYGAPRIIDAFLANDEIELARFRIQYLKSHVDLVVIGESKVTFRGNKKPLVFSEWLTSTSDLSQRVVTVSLDLEGEDAWQRESSAREGLLEFLIENYPEDGYIISDLDEIPSRSQVATMRKLRGDYHFHTPTFYRKANWSTTDWNLRWNKAVFTTRSDKNWPNAGRHHKLPTFQSSENGCHFSYLGFGAEQMRNKLKSFSHIELDSSDISDQVFLDYCDKFLIDHLGRIDSESFGLLRQLNFDELSDVARELFSYKPEYFHFGEIRENKINRLFASALVSLVTGKSILSKDAFNVISKIRISQSRKLYLYCRCAVMILKSLIKRQLRKLKNSQWQRQNEN